MRQAAEAVGPDGVVIVDSLSHAWNNEGGVLEIKDRIAGQAGKNSYTAWNEAGREQNDLINYILGVDCHTIVTMRSKMEYAMELAGKFGIRYQEAVRRGGSTNAGRISLIGKAVPVLVLGVPSRYVHSHYNFCAKDDLEAATELAAQVIKGLDGERIRHILRQDIL